MSTLTAAGSRSRPGLAALNKAVVNGIGAMIVGAAVLAGGVSPADAAPQPAKAESVVVMVDHAKVVRLPEKAQTVIVGNPAIADVAIQKNGVMIVTGKSFGVTNLIALDASGTLLAESLVRVGADSDSVLTVQRGLERESYSCTPVCQPTAVLGDASRHFGEVGSQASARNGAALSAGKR